jgi:tRNA pseudouridine38-40 synthase
MMRYKLVVAYDGTDFSGWQVQPHAPSVAQALQDALHHVFREQIVVIGASRTDAGVHALGQVAAFSSKVDLPPERMKKILNDVLPSSILVRSVETVYDAFNPIYGVASKAYGYHFFTKRPMPYLGRYGWYVPYAVDIELLQEALAIFVGTHDFRSFCTGDEMAMGTVRTIDAISLRYHKRYDGWQINFTGPGFLRHMLRRIVGAAFDVAARRRLTVTDLRAVLAAKDPRQTLYNAPGHGLCLYRISYKNDLK